MSVCVHEATSKFRTTKHRTLRKHTQGGIAERFHQPPSLPTGTLDSMLGKIADGLCSYWVFILF